MFWFSFREHKKSSNSVLNFFTLLEYVPSFSSEVNETAEVALSKIVFVMYLHVEF